MLVGIPATHTSTAVGSVQKCSVVIWLSQSKDATAALCVNTNRNHVNCLRVFVIERESVHVHHGGGAGQGVAEQPAQYRQRQLPLRHDRARPERQDHHSLPAQVWPVHQHRAHHWIQLWKGELPMIFKISVLRYLNDRYILQKHKLKTK